MKTLYTAKVDVRSGRDGTIRSDDGQLDVRLDFPAALGGKGAGTNPEQLFAAGYAACFATSLSATAKESGSPLTQVAVASEVDMLHDGTTWDLAVRLVVRAEGVSRSVLAGLIEKTKTVCPYSRATRGSLATSVTIAEGTP